jgi:hypothetical protein
MELGIRLSFVKTSEFRRGGGGGVEPSHRYATEHPLLKYPQAVFSTINMRDQIHQICEYSNK